MSGKRPSGPEAGAGGSATDTSIGVPSKLRTRLGAPVHQRWPATAGRVWTVQCTGSLASPVETCVTAAPAPAGAPSAAATPAAAAAVLKTFIVMPVPPGARRRRLTTRRSPRSCGRLTVESRPMPDAREDLAELMRRRALTEDAARPDAVARRHAA